jgi:hypothetical protein
MPRAEWLRIGCAELRTLACALHLGPDERVGLSNSGLASPIIALVQRGKVCTLIEMISDRMIPSPR